MQYMLMYNEPATEFAKRNSPSDAPIYWGAWNAYIGALMEAGIVRGGSGLQAPELSTTVRMRDGKRHVQDGPIPDTKEHLGGYFVIDVATLDEALEWAARSPSASVGNVEVRPVMPPPSGAPVVGKA
jgi:hypothetical protein